LAQHTETPIEMQVRIAREMQTKDAARAEYWLAMEKKALAGRPALPESNKP